jgi:hypothetical protein
MANRTREDAKVLSYTAPDLGLDYREGKLHTNPIPAVESALEAALSGSKSTEDGVEEVSGKLYDRLNGRHFDVFFLGAIRGDQEFADGKEPDYVDASFVGSHYANIHDEAHLEFGVDKTKNEFDRGCTTGFTLFLNPFDMISTKLLTGSRAFLYTSNRGGSTDPAELVKSSYLFIPR